MDDELVEHLLGWKAQYRGDGDESTIPLAAKAAARIQSDAAEIAALKDQVAEAREELQRVTGVKQDHWRNVQRLAAITVTQDKALAEARGKAVADVAAWLRDSGGKDAEDLRRLHADKRLSPAMTKEWETLIQTKTSIATALETGEWEK